MGRRGGVLVAFAAASFALGGTALGGVGTSSIETKKFKVPGNVVTMGTATCPPGSKPTGGGHRVSMPSPTDLSIRVNALRPNGGRGWAAEIDRFNEPDSLDAKAYAICRSRTGSRSVVEGAAFIDGAIDNFDSVGAKCPKGTSVIGGGAASSGGHTDVYILGSYPVGNRTWVARAFVDTFYTGNLRAIAYCDSSDRASYTTAEKTTTEPLRRSSTPRGTVYETRATARCAKGSRLTGGGYAIFADDPNISVLKNHPDGLRKWVAGAHTYNPEDGFTSYVRCLER